MSLGTNLTFHASGKDNKEKKLAIICGWMGAKPKQLKTYTNYYHDKGFDTLAFAVGPQHVLKPASALVLMEDVIKQSLELKPASIVHHHFSVGGYLFGQMLRVLGRPENATLKASFEPLIKAQVFDSPPDMRGIAAGVGASMGANVLIAKPVEWAISAYLAAVKNTAGVEHAAASNSFHGNHVPAPSIWFYSKADPVCNFNDCETVIGKWKARGTEVEEIVWEDTPHIQHGRVDPGRYFGSLSAFLIKHDLAN